MKRFTDNTLLGDILQIAHDTLKQHKYADIGLLDQLGRLGEEAFQRTSMTRTRSDGGEDSPMESARKRFASITGMIDNIHNDKELNELSRTLALNTIVVNAVSSAERARETPTPEVQISEYLTGYFSKADDKQKAVADLKAVLDDLVLSFVHTSHPTVFHSPAARRFEKALSGLLENPDNVKEVAAGGPLRLMQGKDAIAGRFSEFIRELKEGKAVITPNPQHPVTVSLETQTEKENYQVIRKELSEVIGAWNKALEHVPQLDDADRGVLRIDEARQKRLFEMRTWGQAADADGREKATSQLLYDSIQNNFGKDGAYEGEIMDMRQNAKVHLDFISALIQVKHRNANLRSNGRAEFTARRYGEDVANPNTGQTFDKFIETFMQQREKKGEKQRQMYAEKKKPETGYYVYSDPKINWRGPKNSIFQQLQRNNNPDYGDVFDDRADFISALIKNDYRLVPEQLHTDVREFTDKLYRLKKAFLGKHKDYIEAAGYTPETITYDEMINVSIPGKSGMVSLRGAWDYVAKRNGVELLHGGLQYNRYFDSYANRHTSELVLDFANDSNVDLQILMQNYLQGTRKLARDGKLSPLTLEERSTMMDTIKRMVVVGDAIDKATAANSSLPVATRYQIANFSEPADFLITLKLFQEAGLVTTEKGTGKIEKTKMGIMPLLETGEDLENAGAIFSRLLDDPASKDIIQSYYKARGRQVHADAQRGRADGGKKEWNGRGQAEIMLGFSDGAATTGNYASQWKIYKAARELTELFDQHGIDVRFFQGRGRGVDRGGTIDPALQMQLMPPEVTKSGIYDATIQSDLPMDLAGSETYGKDYFTKAFLGTLNATLKGRAMTGEERGHMKECEAGIDWIADRAREVYNSDVRNNPDALGFLDPKHVPNNPTTTSRRAARKDNPEFDEIRAIPKEYYANGADLPMHNVGLGQAISQFISLWDKSGHWVGDYEGIDEEGKKCKKHIAEEIVIHNGKGEKVTGAAAFRALSEHPFHQAMLQTVTAGMQHYDPVIAKAYGEITKSEPFVAKVMTHLNGLGETLNRHTEQGLTYTPSWTSALDHIAHGIILSGIRRGKPIKPNFNLDDERQWGETLYNSLFVTSQEIGHRQLPRKERDQQTAVAV